MARGKWGFAELLSHGSWEPLNTGGCVIALKSGGWSRSCRVAMPDVRSESEADRAERNRAVARTLARLGDGWMVEWNTPRRPSPGYPEGGSFPDPVTRLIDEAQRLRFLEDGTHFASETFFTLTYQPPSPNKSSVERWIFGGEYRSTSRTGSAR
jgi:type IV secretory pathway VirB4 component